MNKKLFIFWLCMIAGVVVLSLIHAGRIQEPYDKLVHVTVYTLLMIPPAYLLTKKRTVYACAFILLTLSGIVEMLQTLTPDREGSWMDFFCNGCGVALGVIIGLKARDILLKSKLP